MNISVSGTRNLRFKLRAAIRTQLNSFSAAEPESLCTSSSVADFFGSFESHRKPALIAIAAFHRIILPAKSNHPTTSAPPETSIPDCKDVCNEWQSNNIHPDLQIHILTALNGTNLTLVPLRRLLATLNIEYSSSDSLRELRKKLKTHIGILRKGNQAEYKADRRETLNDLRKAEARARYNEKIQHVVDSWPQLVPRSLKDRVFNIFRDQTSSEALSTFTCAACGVSAPLRSHCTLNINGFDKSLLLRHCTCEKEHGASRKIIH
ncbi:hypothetical protein R3P38DRAFT_2849495 [Favolaschia claudopus]|uniref:Uncharacterized protein n=1 Tax=Favolaschia claudopus TaxID=2862362 RepID=A0AAW0DX23_9AGAR